MAAFDPQTEYKTSGDKIRLEEFSRYAAEFVVRPPYQRKSVWSTRKQQALLDSLFRRYYVPRIVIREVRLSDGETVKEIIDGQQRIITAQLFFANQLRLPKTLADISPQLPGKCYRELPVSIKRFADRLVYDADIVTGIDDPRNPDHQKIATEIFWRLQQGESLNYMEIAHARVSSLVRNFVVKYADDITFDYDAYRPIDENPDKHPFFNIIDRKNDRMQHLTLLTRFLILEESLSEHEGGAANMRDLQVSEYIERHQVPDGIGNLSFERTPAARRVISVMDRFHKIFKDDPMIANDESSNGIKEFRIEYFIISVFLLLRHLLEYYVFGEAEEALFRQFVIDFHTRWRARSEDDNDILVFSDNRQHSAAEIEVRQRIITQLFFEYAAEHGRQMLAKDSRRAFSEAERIAIYRRDNGMCQMCVAEGRSEEDCIVPWSKYQADHVVPHSRGGRTAVDNAQVLCDDHNRSKGATFSAS